MTRAEVAKKFLDLYLDKGNLTIVASPGLGKTKISFDIILATDCKTILYSSPSLNLKNNLEAEFVKHNFPKENYALEITSIQTAYKYVGKEYDLLVLDEAHQCISNEYKKLLLHNNFKHILFLTATPEDYKEEKKVIYDTYAPIYWRYLDSEKDGIVNKVKVIHYAYELTNDFTKEIKTKKWGKSSKFKVGELEHYEYLNKQIVKGRIMMNEIGSENFYLDSFAWLNKSNAPSDAHYTAALLYNRAVANRKKFLLNLESTKHLAKDIIKLILLADKNNKVLFFAEEIKYLQEINDNVYYAENPNKDLLYNNFMKGYIRSLGASKGLNVGLNMVGVNHLLFVNYVGSSTTGEQRAGRGRRLNVNELATLIILHPLNTQFDTWYENMMKLMTVEDIVHVHSIDELKRII